MLFFVAKIAHIFVTLSRYASYRKHARLTLNFLRALPSTTSSSSLRVFALLINIIVEQAFLDTVNNRYLLSRGANKSHRGMCRECVIRKYFQSESPSRKRRRISRNGAVSGIEVREATPPAPTPPLHPTPPPWEYSGAPQRRSPRNHMSTRGSPTVRNRYRYADSFSLSYPFIPPGHNPHQTIHNSHHGLHNSHHNIHNSHHNLHNSHHGIHNAHQAHPHHAPGTGHHPAQGANAPVVVDVGQVGVSGLGVAVSGEPLWHAQATGYRIPCQLHSIYTPHGTHPFGHSCQVNYS